MAFNSARPIRQWRHSWSQSLNTLLERFCLSQGETKGIKDFITVLMFYREYEANEVETAVDLAVKNNISTSDGVHHVFSFGGGSETTIPPLSAWPSLPPPNITVYGQLGGVR
jgi:hypothetical protein